VLFHLKRDTSFLLSSLPRLCSIGVTWVDGGGGGNVAIATQYLYLRIVIFLATKLKRGK
jgi:hypothetical protein